MSQRKYVRMSEQSHMQLRLLAATIDRSVPDVCEMLVDYALETLEFWTQRTLSGALPLMEPSMADEVAVAVFVPERCTQAHQILTERIDQVMSAALL